MFAPGAAYADWSAQYTVNGSATYTDNFELAPAGQGHSALVTTLGAGTRLRANGDRGNLAADYTLNAVNRSIGGESVRFRNDLSATGTAIPIPDWLYVDGSASALQALINSQSRISTTPDAGRGQESNVETVGISPYLRHRFDWADAELRYRFQHAFVDTGSDTQRNQGQLALRHDFSGALATFGNADFDDISVRRQLGSYRRTLGRAGIEYTLNRYVSLTGSGGWERIRIDRGQGINGPIALGGLVLRPGPRTEIEIAAGRRFDRLNVGADARYRIAEGSLAGVRYQESVISRNEDFLQADVARTVDTLGRIVDSRTGVPELPLPRRGTTNQGVFLARTSDVYVDWPIGSAARFRVGAFYDILQPLTVGSLQEANWGLRARWTQSILPKTRIQLDALYRRGHIASTAASDTFLERIELIEDLTDKFALSIAFSRADRLSSAASDRYRENAATAALVYAF